MTYDIESKASTSYIDIEGAFIDIEKSSISGYNNIEVLNFDRYRAESISIFYASISAILRYRTVSISNVSTFDIDIFWIQSIRSRITKHSISSLISYLDIKGHLVTLDIERFNCNIVIYLYRRSDARYRTSPRFQMLHSVVGFNFKTVSTLWMYIPSVSCRCKLLYSGVTTVTTLKSWSELSIIIRESCYVVKNPTLGPKKIHFKASDL